MIDQEMIGRPSGDRDRAPRSDSDHPGDRKPLVIESATREEIETFWRQSTLGGKCDHSRERSRKRD